VVRETVAVRLTGGEQEIVLSDVPLDARLSSMVLRTRRIPIRLLSWERESPPSGKAGPQLDGDDLTWQPGSPGVRGGAPPKAATRVKCRIASPVDGIRPVFVTYVVDGFDWSARYQLVVRGEVEKEDMPVAVDLEGKAVIHNPTRRAFEAAQVVLVGEGAPREGAPVAAPGILDLEEGPLSELWKPQPPEPVPSYAYRIPGRVSLWAEADSEVPMVNAVRVPARRVHVLRAEAFALGVGPMRPLRKLIAFDNSGTRGLGVPLPPGATQIYLGRKDRLLQEGLLSRTAAGESIRIELGRSELVEGRRRMLGYTDAAASEREDVLEVLIRNHHTSPVHVEIDERPPSPFRWTVTRANVRYEVKNQRLLFDLLVNPSAEKRIEYRIRSERPQL
jgi:hypothetical protein